MKTALEELIEYIEEWTPKNKTTDGIWSKAKNLLSKEKEQIIKAVDYGYELYFSDDDNTYTKGEEYFQETFSDNVV